MRLSKNKSLKDLDEGLKSTENYFKRAYRCRYRYIFRSGGLLVTGGCLHIVLKFLLHKQC